MINPKVYGFHAEGQNLCLVCAQRRYGDSLEMYVNSGDIQVLDEQERLFYTNQGLLCDECLDWIFQPVKTGEYLLQEDPEPAEHLRLLAPFADFLETLQIDALNLRVIFAV